MKRHIFLSLSFLAAACGTEGDTLSKDEARDLGGKADQIDLCLDNGWYGDGICDEFCLQPDPDCTGFCFSSEDCGDGTHCSLDDGDCLDICEPGVPCPDVCAGVCVPDEPEPVTCVSSNECGPNQHCSTEDGDCDSLCDPGQICPAVCAGVCVDDGPDECWGAWLDENDTCRSPNDGIYPQECCDGLGEDVCGGLLGLGCDQGEYCDYGDMCNVPDATGVCKSKDAFCSLQLDPVCGCDGVTYNNACFANNAGVSVLHEGDCNPANECWGAWIDELGNCRNPADGVYPDECCAGL